MDNMLIIYNSSGTQRVTLICDRPDEEPVTARYEKLKSGGEGWLLLRQTEMVCSWDRAVSYAEKIVEAGGA